MSTDATTLDIETGATAVAHPNMALIKYWGKRDRDLILPVTGSLSMTLDIFPTTTRVRVGEQEADTIALDGRPADEVTTRRVTGFLRLVRDITGRHEAAAVDSVNSVPTGAGLASSASGFAALAAAACAAYDHSLPPRELSRLARRGSGSACRSVFGDFVVWHPGDSRPPRDDLGSYAEPVPAGDFDPAMVIAIVDGGGKAVSSRKAMQHTVETSPFYLPWAAGIAADLERMRAAIGRGDLQEVGRIAEHNALSMHATMLAARPAVRYLQAGTLAVLDAVAALRAGGIDAYATIDAGPNVAVLCDPRDEIRVARAVSELPDVSATHIAHRGPGTTVTAGAAA
ncbi:diphosphomevalonate decarboxylase [Nocardia tengchongensis]|uniref:diphosphomevalonate decarboxylase n=1 Tax=Nocardia tengchongensis TaxID=2055889 RepID=UPI0036C185EB